MKKSEAIELAKKNGYGPRLIHIIQYFYFDGEVGGQLFEDIQEGKLSQDEIIRRHHEEVKNRPDT